MQKLMEQSLKDGRMIFSIDFGYVDEQKSTAEEVLLGASDIIAQATALEKVFMPKYNTDPSSMDLRTSPESPEDVA